MKKKGEKKKKKQTTSPYCIEQRSVNKDLNKSESAY